MEEIKVDVKEAINENNPLIQNGVQDIQGGEE